MANAGDTFTVELNQAQLEWGTFRFTGSRGLRYGEGYLKIPKPVALNLQLFDGNHTSGYDILGENIFHATSADGLFTVHFVQKVVPMLEIHMLNNLQEIKISWPLDTGIHRSTHKSVI